VYESLKEFNNIVVSGPQRSGTRIVAKIIAYETGKQFIDERDLNFHDYRLLKFYLERGNFVIQCPGLCHLLHYIEFEDTLIIVSQRPIQEIIRSERLHWSNESRLIELYKYGRCEGIISRIKYSFWSGYQQPILGDRGRNIGYHSLESHKLFITDRKNFKWDQTE